MRAERRVIFLVVLFDVLSTPRDISAFPPIV